MLLTAWRAGQDRALRLFVQPNCIGFIDRDKNTLVENGIALAVKQNQIRRPEATPCQHDGFGSATVASATFSLPMITLLTGRSSLRMRA